MNTEAAGQTTDSSQVRDRAIRLFTYLKELCKLRTTQVRNVASYDQVFWLSDLPRDSYRAFLVDTRGFFNTVRAEIILPEMVATR